jgi:flagellar hook-basal body protein
MIRSLFSGVSGMKNHQIRMDVIGNNIANVNTSGYKAGRTNFQDTLYQSVKNSGINTNPAQAGLGITVSAINSNMNQGGLQSTGRTLDLAISGSGFYKVTDGVRDYFTRDGVFYIAQDGSIVNSSGYKLYGIISSTAKAESGIYNDKFNELQPVTEAVPLAGGELPPAGSITGLSINNDNQTYQVQLFVNNDGTVQVSTDGGANWQTATISGNDITFDLNGDTITLAGWGPGGAKDITTAVGSHITFSISDSDATAGTVTMSVSDPGYVTNTGSFDPATAVSNYTGLVEGDNFTVDLMKQPDGAVYYRVDGGGWNELIGSTVTLAAGKTAEIDTTSLAIGDAFTFNITVDVTPTAATPMYSGTPAGLAAGDVSGLGANNDNQTYQVQLFVNNDGTVQVSTDGGANWQTATISGNDITFDLNGDTITLAGWGPGGAKDITTAVGSHITFSISDSDATAGTVTMSVSDPGYVTNTGSFDPATAVSNYTGLVEGDNFTVDLMKQPDGAVYYRVDGGGWNELIGSTVTLAAGKTAEIDTTSLAIGDAFTFNITVDVTPTAATPMYSGAPAGLVAGDVFGFGTSINNLLPANVHLFVDNNNNNVYFSTDGGLNWQPAAVSADNTGIIINLNGTNITLTGWGPAGNYNITANAGTHLQFDIVDSNTGDGIVTPVVENLDYVANTGDLDTFSAVSNYTGLVDGDNYNIKVFKNIDGNVYYQVDNNNEWVKMENGIIELGEGKHISLDPSGMEPGDAYNFDVNGIALVVRGTKGDGTLGQEKTIIIEPTDINVSNLISKINKLSNQTGVQASESGGKLVFVTDDKTEKATMAFSGSAAGKLGLPQLISERKMSEPTELKIELPPGASIDSLIILPDGRIYGRDSQGNLLNWSIDGKDVAQIVLYNFPNQDGLQRTAQNLFQASASSGNPLDPGTPGSLGFGTIESGYLELSNVDLTDEFSNMITTQRGYQANARIITVSDTMLEELLNLKR